MNAKSNVYNCKSNFFSVRKSYLSANSSFLVFFFFLLSFFFRSQVMILFDFRLILCMIYLLSCRLLTIFCPNLRGYSILKNSIGTFTCIAECKIYSMSIFSFLHRHRLKSTGRTSTTRLRWSIRKRGRDHQGEGKLPP